MMERIRSAVSRFDIILTFILLFAVFSVCMNVWLIINGYEQMSAAVWTFCGTITGGEIVAFSLYQIAKKITNAKAPNTMTGKHGYINDIEKDGE